MDVIIVIIITAIAVTYIYRHFASGLKIRDLSCGCGHCGSLWKKELSIRENGNHLMISKKWCEGMPTTHTDLEGKNDEYPS